MPYSPSYFPLYETPGPDEARPTVEVQVGLDAALLDAWSTVAWTTVPAVEALSWEMGRQHELGRFEPGRATVTIDDRDRLWDPTNTTLPYDEKLTPMKRLRIRATWAGVTYDLFYGYVIRWPRQWQYRQSAHVTIEAVDLLGILNMWPKYDSPWEQVVRSDEPTAWLRLGESGGTANEAGDTSGNGFGGTYQNGPTRGEPGLIAGDDSSSVYFAHTADQRVSIPRKDLVTGYPFTIECWIRTPQDRSKYKVILSAVSSSVALEEQLEIGIRSSSAGADAGKVVMWCLSGAGMRITHSGQTVDSDTLHHVVCQMDSPTVSRIYVDGVNSSSASVIGTLTTFPRVENSWAIGNTPAVAYGDFGFDGWIQDVVVYQGVTLSAVDIALRHYLAGYTGWAGDTTGGRLNVLLDEIGFPSADRAVDTGVSTLGPSLRGGDLLSYFQAVDQTEYGALFVDRNGKLTFHGRHRILTNSTYTTSQITFSDSDSLSEVHYEPPAQWERDHADVRNVAAVTREGGAKQVVKDVTSVASYGERKVEMSVLHQSDEQAKDLAGWLVRQFAQPTTRFRSVTVLPEMNPTDDWPKILGAQMRQRVTVTATPPAGASFTQQAHIERWRHQVDRDRWQVTYDLATADLQTYWVLGTSLLDTGTRLGY